MRSKCNGMRPLSQRPCESVKPPRMLLPSDFRDARHLEEIAAVEIHEQEPGTRIDHKIAERIEEEIAR